ncbi:hypothetical protein LUZ61_000004 [Rhynchospora tenuis]|uniref:Leucine-rich repeat-containing N-terminal plant-type domain-containing protein n=1 Tax=Rhynchospora tenuis TaxID=198213 RepID=A0AAD5ZEM7_9POAL|nr:hypothetical protein LUZ61_021067 [Rhynchospora tenuis]KAJ3696299.1 hypothetical protein LUZ61_000004 [Rhynchospora tenuis]
MRQRELLLFLLLCIAIIVPPGFSYTDPDDVAVLKSFLKKQGKNVPSDWKNSDPCGVSGNGSWVGIICHDSRVANLTLFNMNIQGTLSAEIGNLKQLQRLDLSSNPKLGGTLPGTLGNLIHLDSLKLVNCTFSGKIPDALGNLPNLTFLALNANNFTGRIPPSLGKLSKLTWLDLADNQLSGLLPVSVNHGWGLDQLLKAEHFHLNQNRFTGKIFEEIFTANMSLRHILLDRNQLEGSIPDSIGLVHTLEVIFLTDDLKVLSSLFIIFYSRLDKNGLTGKVPLLSNLTKLNFLNLANNHLTGPLPNLTALTALNFLDLSTNQFDLSEAPTWLSNLQHLRTLAIESGQLRDQIPQELFSFKELQEVNLKNNSLNGTFDMGNDVTSSLYKVNLELNNITSVTLSPNYSNNLMLMGNPVCSIPHLSTTAYCNDAFDQSSAIGSLNITDCSHPFTGFLVLRAPFFSDHLITSKNLNKTSQED